MSIHDRPWKELTSGERTRRSKANKARRALEAMVVEDITVEFCRTCCKGKQVATVPGTLDITVDACSTCKADPVKAAAYKAELDGWVQFYQSAPSDADLKEDIPW